MRPSMALRPQHILFSILFLSVCNPLWATTPDTATPAGKTIKMLPVDKNRESAVQQWIRTRAEYEKTLDYASLEQEDAYKYKTMRTLVEIKYFLSLAEKDLQYNSDKSVALDDFNQARRLVAEEATTINAANKQKLDVIHQQLDKMQQAIRDDIASGERWLPVDQRTALDSILAQIEDMINMQ